jgi:hypothetical protein
MANHPPRKIADIDETIERAGRELGWTPKYVALLATTTSSLFAAHDNPETLPVGRDLANELIATMRESLQARGKSAKTLLTYASAWRRISAIVEDSDAARQDHSEREFWASFATEYRDPRIARRRSRRVRMQLPPDAAVTVPDGETAKISTYEVRLSKGIATMTLPDMFSGDDAITIVETVTRHLRRTRDEMQRP